MPPPPVPRFFVSSTSADDDILSPLQVHDQLKARDIGTSDVYAPGTGVTNPQDFNNVGFFILFAVIGVSFVIASIWFFFWAKNGGFHFKKGDWSDYKSTVLRRKGPDGKTLSNATKSTKLGGGSVVGSDYTDTTASMSAYTDAEKANQKDSDRRKKPRHHKRGNRHDADVRAYREERPARVGGLNKAPEGTSYDGSTNPSSSQPAMSEVNNGRTTRYHTPKGERAPRRDLSYNHSSEASFSVVSDNSQAPLRGQHNSSPPKQYRSNRERRSQGYYAQRASEGSYVEPIDFHGTKSHSSNASVAQVQNTKSYKHAIPGLTKGPVAPSSGFRRGGGGRRDSLSDSDG